ncbi:MAG: diguanylate cyclase [Kiritimatiellae bacterium]|nr:diguanylate cyclase [Kiritimatiellia bacterium]
MSQAAGGKGVGGADLAGIRALVIDDQDIIRDTVGRVLGSSDCEVEEAEDGRSALEALLQRDFDVVVVDLRMQGMDGLTFLSEALRIWPWLGVVIMSGYLDQEALQQAARLGVHSFVKKPIDWTTLVERVAQEAADKRQSLSRPAGVSLGSLQHKLGIFRKISTSAIESETLLGALRNLCMGLGEMFPAAVIGILSMETQEPVLVLYVVDPIGTACIREIEEHIRSRYRALSGRDLPEHIRIQTEGAACTDDGPQDLGSCLAVPVITGGQVEGLVTLAAGSGQAYSETDTPFLYHAANSLSTVLLAFRRIRQLAIRDGLTGLYNRRHLMEEMDRVWHTALRCEHPVGLAVVDVDNFKTVNDTYGHAVGDEVIKELSEIAMHTVRASDIIGRYGGDEFVIVLPGAATGDAVTFSKRLLKQVRTRTFCEGSHNLNITVSIGVASTSHQESLLGGSVELLGLADGAMYAAKRQGRDRICSWPPDLAAGDPDAAGSSPGVATGGRVPNPGRDTDRHRELVVSAFATMLEAREREVTWRMSSARSLARIMGRALSVTDDDLRDLTEGALLHDLGKVGIPDAILLKPSSLSREEMGVIRTHPEIGFRILRSFPFLEGVAQIVLSHQERFDGTGYPRKLKGQQICLGARIVAVIDAYDAMRSNRAYRQSLPLEAAVAEIQGGRGTQFDPDVVDVFMKCLPEVEQAGGWENPR